MRNLNILFRNENFKLDFQDWLNDEFNDMSIQKYVSSSVNEKVNIILDFILEKDGVHLVKNLIIVDGVLFHDLKLVDFSNNKLDYKCESRNDSLYDAYICLLSAYIL